MSGMYITQEKIGWLPHKNLLGIQGPRFGSLRNQRRTTFSSFKNKLYLVNQWGSV